MTPRLGSLCTGYGGVEQGLTLAGIGHQTVFVADPDPAASRLLAHRYPTTPNLGDITRIDWTTVEPVDILTAGFPCQDMSMAGKRQGLQHGNRSGLWFHVADAIDALRPPLVILENVRGILSARAHSDLEPCPWCLGDEPDEPPLRALGAVLGTLANLGYDTAWTSLPAAAVGACHLRWRVFITAWPTDSPSLGHGYLRPSARSRVPAPVERGSATTPDLMPTPAARLADRYGQPNAVTAARRMGEEGRRNLDDAVALLPTPTPTARDGDGRGEGTHTYWQERGGVDQTGAPLGAVAALLPTPRASEGEHGGPNQRGSAGDLTVSSAVQPNRWGTYAAAVAQHERTLGRPAPAATEPGTKGQPRLNPRFVEWMQMLPSGWVCDVPGVSRNEQLRLLGNGVVPVQLAAAIPVLAAMMGT